MVFLKVSKTKGLKACRVEQVVYYFCWNSVFKMLQYYFNLNFEEIMSKDRAVIWGAVAMKEGMSVRAAHDKYGVPVGLSYSTFYRKVRSLKKDYDPRDILSLQIRKRMSRRMRWW